MVTKSNKGQSGAKSTNGKPLSEKEGTGTTSKEQNKLTPEKGIAATHKGFYHEITPGGKKAHMTENDIQQRRMNGPYSTDDEEEDDDEGIEPGQRSSSH